MFLCSDPSSLQLTAEEEEEEGPAAPATPATPAAAAGSPVDVEQIQALIDKSLELYAADRVAMPDYALESSGNVCVT